MCTPLCETATHDCGLRLDESRDDPRHVTIVLAGDLDHACDTTVDRVLARSSAPRPDVVTLDLSRVTFLNAGGLRSLARAARVADTRRVRLVLRCGPGATARLVTIVGMGDRLETPSG